MPQPLLIVPSLLAADWSRVSDELQRAEDAGAQWLHLDVMDGHFVDNISFGPQMVAAVAKHTRLTLDTHLMIHRPDHYLERFIQAGCHNITIHVEARYDTSLRETLRRIRAAGLSAGLALNPATPFSAAQEYMHEIDLLLIMTVVPGFGGQPFMEQQTMPKLAEARDYFTRHDLAVHLEVDGGIHAGTAPIAKRHGANVFVCGTSAFGSPDMRQSMATLAAAVA